MTILLALLAIVYQTKLHTQFYQTETTASFIERTIQTDHDSSEQIKNTL
jgi:hypothetical protein